MLNLGVWVGLLGDWVEKILHFCRKKGFFHSIGSSHVVESASAGNELASQAAIGSEEHRAVPS